MSKKMIILTVVLSIIFACIGFVSGGLIYGFTNPLMTEKLDIPADEETEKPGGGQTDIPAGELSIHFLELGNQYTGDCIYIKAGETDILVDAGSRTNSVGTISAYLDKFVTDKKLEYVIATHADRDHIACFAGDKTNESLFTKYDVDMIIDFPKTNKTTQTYNNYVLQRDAAVKNGATHYTALQCFNNQDGAQSSYMISDNIEMEILYNYYYTNHTGDENNYSVCFMINQGTNHYLFTGDLEKSGETKLVEYYDSIEKPLPHCKLFKAGHHGSPTSSNDCLLSKITPEYVAVTCCAGSSEYTDNIANQFPSQQFIDNISKYTNKVYVTSMYDELQENKYMPMNGNIVFNINGAQLEVSCSNNDTLLKDTAWFKQYRQCPIEWNENKI